MNRKNMLPGMGLTLFLALMGVVLALSLSGCESGTTQISDAEVESVLDLSEVNLTDGTSANDSDGFVFTTQVEDNRFDCVCFMVHNLENNNYTVFCRGSTPGKFTDSYTHNQPSGTYEVIVKGNTNLADERATFDMDLEQGKTYFASFTVDSFSEQHIEISNVKFG